MAGSICDNDELNAMHDEAGDPDPYDFGDDDVPDFDEALDCPVCYDGQVQQRTCDQCGRRHCQECEMCG